jgi:hypothetical protein
VIGDDISKTDWDCGSEWWLCDEWVLSLQSVI